MRNFFTDEFIEEVRINNDIIDVVSEYVKLEKKGRYLFGLCPFHSEKTPSFSVTPDMQIFNCFGCNKGGNVIHFIMNIENLDFVEAIKFLAERARIQLPSENGTEVGEELHLRNEILDINKFAAQCFYGNLISTNGIKAKEYLKKRGIEHSTIKKFGLGYSLPYGNKFYKLLQEKSFSNEAIIKSGLIIRSKTGEYFDRFRNRLMFPIFNIRGNVIGFGGRALDDSLPKYMNSPETMVYNKGRNLYALNFAKNSRENRLIIVEGYIDVITLHQYGIINTVASLGTALTENQGRLLKKYAEEIIISFDSDGAGISAAMKSLDLLAGIGCNAKVLTIPDGKDPDEYVRKNGAKEFIKLMDKSSNLVEYKISNLKKNIDTSNIDGKIDFIKKTADILSKIDSQAELEIYIKKLSKQYDISVEALYSEVLKGKKQKRNIKEVKQYSERKNRRESYNKNLKVNYNDNDDNAKKNNYSELLLIAILCLDNGIYKSIKDKIDKDDFSSENKQLAKSVFEKLESRDRVISGELISLMDANKAAEFTRIINNECNFENSEKAAMDVINRIYMVKLEDRKKEVLETLKGRDKLENIQISNLLKELNELVFEIKKLSDN